MEGIKFFKLSDSKWDRSFLHLLVAVLKENDIESELEKAPLTESWDQLQKRMAGGRAALLDISGSEKIISQIPALPTDIRLLKCADALYFEEGSWWPRLNIKEALRELIVTKARSLNIKESAYIIGQGALLRVLAAQFVSFGYSRIFLVSSSLDDAEEQKNRLKNNFVGVDWQPLEASQLTMQTLGASVLVNSLPFHEFPALMGDLAYFNFMSHQGLVVDLNIEPFENPLLEEAHRAELRTLSGFEIQSHKYYGFLQKLGLSGLISLADFSTRWLADLKQAEARL